MCHGDTEKEMVMIEKYEFKIEEIHGNESDFCVYDRNGIKCCRYDTLYDESGSEYIFDGVVYVRPHGFFQRFFLIGKAGYKAALSLRVSNGLYYADTIYVEPELVHQWYSHERFGKGLKHYKNNKSVSQ